MDRHQFASIGFALVGNDLRYINGKVDHLLRFIESLHVAEVLNSKIEIMTVSEFPETVNGNAGKYDEF